MLQTQTLREILDIENIIAEEINAEIEDIAEELEELVELSQEFPDFLKVHSEKISRIDEETVSSIENIENANKELHQASLLKISIVKLKSLLIGGGTGVFVGAVVGSFFPVVGSVVGGCIGVMGGTASGYLISHVVRV